MRMIWTACLVSLTCVAARFSYHHFGLWGLAVAVVPFLAVWANWEEPSKGSDEFERRRRGP